MFLIDCKQASIYSTQNEYLCHAAVSRIEEDSVTLTMGGLDNDLLPSKVHVTFFDSVKGLITYSCDLLDFRPAEHLSGQGHVCARCVINEQLALVQRRRDIKVPVNISVVLSARTSKGEVSNVLATIWNISAGGILFTCSHPFLPTAGSLLSPFRRKSCGSRTGAAFCSWSAPPQENLSFLDSAVTLYISRPRRKRRSEIMSSGRI